MNAIAASGAKNTAAKAAKTTAIATDAPAPDAGTSGQQHEPAKSGDGTAAATADTSSTTPIAGAVAQSDTTGNSDSGVSQAVIAAAAQSGPAAAAVANSAAPEAKKSSSEDSDKPQSDGSPAANSPTVPASTAAGPAAAVPAAPIDAAASANATVNPPAAPGNVSASAIGSVSGQPHGRSNQSNFSSPLVAASQTAAASQPGQTSAAAHPSAAAGQGQNAKAAPVDTGTAQPSATANVNAPASGSPGAQQASADATSSPQPEATFSLPANLVTHLDAAANGAAGSTSSNTQAANAVKSAAANLPAFALVAGNAGTTQTAAATSATTSAGAVSIAGLPVAIATRAQAGSNQFDIRLDPPELGRIDVRLSVDGSGQVTSHVTVDRPETLTLLQNQQPQLERALEQAGLKTADNGLQFSLRDQSFAGQNGGNGGNAQLNTTQQQLVIPDSEMSPVETAQIYSRLGLSRGLDITV